MGKGWLEAGGSDGRLAAPVKVVGPRQCRAWNRCPRSRKRASNILIWCDLDFLQWYLRPDSGFLPVTNLQVIAVFYGGGMTWMAFGRRSNAAKLLDTTLVARFSDQGRGLTEQLKNVKWRIPSAAQAGNTLHCIQRNKAVHEAGYKLNDQEAAALAAKAQTLVAQLEELDLSPRASYKAPLADSSPLLFIFASLSKFAFLHKRSTPDARADDQDRLSFAGQPALKSLLIWPTTITFYRRSAISRAVPGKRVRTRSTLWKLPGCPERHYYQSPAAGRFQAEICT